MTTPQEGPPGERGHWSTACLTGRERIEQIRLPGPRQHCLQNECLGQFPSGRRGGPNQHQSLLSCLLVMERWLLQLGPPLLVSSQPVPFTVLRWDLLKS